MNEIRKSAQIIEERQSVIGARKLFMIRIACLTVFLLLFTGLAPGIVNANPPKSMTLSYDATKKLLKVTLLHPSYAPNWHYIKTVAIEKNKQPLVSYSYKNQKGDEFTYTYDVSVIPGDTLMVTATCSMYGSLTETIKIP